MTPILPAFALPFTPRHDGGAAMKRREMLRSTGAAVLGLSAFPLGWVAAEEKKKPSKVLYFTRSVAYEHSVVKRDGDRLSYSERILTDVGKEHGVVVDCTKDGRVFDGDLDQYDAIAFYNCGNPDEPAVDGGAPISPERQAASVGGDRRRQGLRRHSFGLLLLLLDRPEVRDPDQGRSLRRDARRRVRPGTANSRRRPRGSSRPSSPASRTSASRSG